MENVIRTGKLQLIKNRVYQSQINGSVCMPVPADSVIAYSDVTDNFSLTAIHGMHNWLYFSDSEGVKRKIKLRPCFEGRARIVSHSFRYFGVCLLDTDGNVLSSSTMWANSHVRNAAKSDQSFLGLIMSRNYFEKHPALRILSMQFTSKGLDVVDPTTHNVSTCNLFCIVG